MTLLEYITSLQDTGLSQEEIFAKAQEFKGRTKTEEVEVIEAPVEEVKVNDVADQTDATVASTKKASEKPFSDAIYGSGESQYQEVDFNKIHENVFGKSIEESEKEEKQYKQDQVEDILGKYEIGSNERTIAYKQLDLAPDDTINKDLYEAYDSYVEDREKLIEKVEEVQEGDAYGIQGLPKVDFSKVGEALGKDTKDYNNFVASVENLDQVSDYIEKIQKEKIEPKPMTIVDRAAGAFLVNLPLGLENAWETSKAATMDWVSAVAGDDVADWMVGEGGSKGIVWIDPETNEEVDFNTDPQKWKELNTRNMGLEDIKSKYKDTGVEVGEAAENYIINQFKKSEALNRARVDVGTFVKEFDITKPFETKFASGDELIGGIFDTIGGFVSTAIPAALTRGASMMPQIAAPMYVDYNIEKAKNLYGDSPDSIGKLIRSGETELTTPLVLGGIAAGLEYVGFKGVAKNLIGKTGIMKPVVSMTLTQNKEGLTELGQLGTETLNKGLGSGKSLSDSMVDALKAMTSKEGVNSYLMGFAGSGIITAPSTIRKALITETEVFNSAAKHINTIASLQLQRSQNKNKDFRKAIDIQIQETESSLKDLLENTNKLANTMTKEEQSEVLNLLSEKSKNTKTLEGLNNSFKMGELTAQQYGSAKGALVNKNKKLSNETSRILAEANTRLIEAEVETVKKFAGEGKVKVYNTTKEFVEATGKDADFDAFINPDTGEIFINKERAAKVGSVTAGSHELLHKIIKQSFSDPETAARLVEDFKSILSAKELAVVQKRIDENYSDQSSEVQNEEFLTSFSDAIGTGELTWSDNLKETFVRLAKPILNIFRGKGYSSLEFESGRDVYDFIKDYQKNIKKGKISERAELLSATGEVDMGLETEVDLGDVKASKKDTGAIASTKVQEIYDTQGEAGAFDIIDQFKPIVNRIVEKRRDAPNFDRQLLTDEIETGKRGIFDLIREYKPESGVPLAAYINKFLPARAIEASQRVLGETFTEDVTEAKGIIAEEVTTEVAEKPVTRKIKPSSFISNDAVAKIKEQVQEKIKGIDPKNLTFKKLGDLAPEIIAAEIGIPVKKLTVATANLSKGDATAIQQFVNKNADKLLKILPEGAVVEAATEKLLGTSTGVPKGLLNAFYTKQARLGKGAGLAPFKLNKGISKADFLETFGIVEGKKAEGFDARSPQAQALKGVASLYGKLVTNEIVRSDTNLSLEAKQDVAAGKSKAMASKRIATEAEMSPQLKKLFEEVSQAKDINSAAKIIGIEGKITVSDSNRAEKQAQMLEYIKAAKIPSSVFIAAKFGNFARRKVDGKYIDLPARGGLYYGGKDPNYQDALALAKENDSKYPDLKAPKRVNVKNAFTKEGQKQSAANMDFLESFTNILNDAVNKKGMPIELAALFITSSYQASSGAIKIAAGFKYESSKFEYAGKDASKASDNTGEKFREEHTIPASVIGANLILAIKNNAVKPTMDAVRENFYQIKLSKKDDTKLDKANLSSTLVEEQTIFDNPITRLAAAGIDLNGIIDPKTGRTIAETVNAGIPKSVYDSYNTTEKLQAVENQNEQIIEAVKNPEYDPSKNIKVYKDLVPGKAMASKRDSDLIPDAIKYDRPITVQTAIDALEKTDKSLELARKLDQPVKKIRVFDFDFTLAKTKSNVLYTMPNFEEGFSEGSTKLKAIFMVGGPGAGKTNVGKGLQLGRRGYKVVNQDIALEAMKAESGLPAKESDYTAEQRSTRSKLGAAARKAAVAKFDKYAANGDGMVIDGTGASYNATTKKIKALEDAGFEVHMVVATTPLETAIERNKARVERSLPDFVVEKTYNQVQESLAKYREDFGNRLYEINTETIEYGKPLPNEFLQKVYAGITASKVGKIDAAEFAEQASLLEEQGAKFDFREFSKVVEGQEGPLLGVAKTIADKRGTKDVFVLTARPANAAGPIKEFLASMGLDIPLANITGLGDGAPQAKAGWIMGKAAEGYNDFYFADDHTGNVKAVKDVLSQIDVKSKVQLAKASKRQTFDTVVNDMIEDSSGIETYKKYSAARAKTVGANKGKYAFLIPPSAEDFTGLLYKMIGKGKKGDAQMAFLKTNLLDTYNRAESAVTQAKISAANDFVALKTELKTLPKTLSKETGIGKFTYSHAVRVAAWTKQGMTVPGLSKRDVKELVDFVNNDAKLRVFTDELIKIQKGKEYPKPGKDWLGGNITTDIIGGINKVNRAEYQQEFRENIDIIFSEENMNKMEAAYGTRWREAMEDSIRRMKSGSNRPIGGNRVTEGLLNWLNNSVGAVMFLNTRSALLQTISAVNFINLGDNNIIKAGRAFANQKQFWGDFMTLMNSDYLVERRNGLKINVSESEIADAVRESQNKPKAAIAFLLSKGFVMTRFADSFAIASGGSTFYRNRLEALKKQGLSDADAKTQAFEDFKAIAEENQQSSSPSKISQQQASAAGRVILAWANTPMQYARIQKRAAQDLINKRGDWKSNVSKIVYYGAIQNLIFNSLQQAVFALGFGDDEEETDEAKAEKKNDKAYKVANGMIDSQLKGLGIFGAASIAVKNTLMTLYEEHGKKSSKYENAVSDLISFSPPLGSKIGKITGGLRSASWNKKDMKEKGFSLDNPAYMAGAQVVTGLTNVPLDRVMKKINNLRGLVNERSALWQKVALGLGWGTWELGLGYYGGFDKKEPLTPKQELKLEVDKMKKDTNKPEQVKTLLDFGLTKKQIRELSNENNRVKKILELQKKDKDEK